MTDGDHPTQRHLTIADSTGDGAQGTGSGLFIAKELARAHDGDVTYQPGTPDRPAGALVLMRAPSVRVLDLGRPGRSVTGVVSPMRRRGAGR
ncbi:ATP-binding protein [Jiangella endophytica]|uniref:HAMP domain-containing histidine kinase n=1 Tax=Jiangella endophytica TaxID=1623398 RepID=UPI000E3480FE|nr:HAMP domain-containing histidine kinase [Jiangella endophytica]